MGIICKSSFPVAFSETLTALISLCTIRTRHISTVFCIDNEYLSTYRKRTLAEDKGIIKEGKAKLSDDYTCLISN